MKPRTLTFLDYCADCGVDPDDDHEVTEALREEYEQLVASGLIRVPVDEKQVEAALRSRMATFPVEWVHNSGPGRRPLEVGMEVRMKRGGEVFRVDSVTPAGVTITPVDKARVVLREHTDEGGTVERVFQAERSSRRIAVLSEVDYRRAQGIDRHTPPVVRSKGGDADTNRQEDSMASKVSAAPIPSGTKTKIKAAKAAKPAKATKVSKPKAKSKGEYDCLCGCGGKTSGYFVPGHDARFKGWLTRIARGEGKPTDFMPASLAKALGPWKPKGNGQIPSKSYRDLRD